jgi:hypothetical protein
VDLDEECMYFIKIKLLSIIIKNIYLNRLRDKIRKAKNKI